MAKAGTAGWVVVAILFAGIVQCTRSCTGSDDTGSSSTSSFADTTRTSSTWQYVQSRNLNCREAPSTANAAVERLSSGDYVEVTEQSNGWARLNRLTDCWVSAKYLGDSRPVQEVQSFASSGGGDDRSARTRRSSVYYANCSAARAAGAAPVYRGEPGYARRLDRDGDGVGCE